MDHHNGQQAPLSVPNPFDDGILFLSSQSQVFNDCPVAFDILAFYVVEQSSASTDEHQQTAP